MLFRALTPAEEAKFRSWARENYKPGAEIKGIWHPVVQDECVRINQEKAHFVVEANERGLTPTGSSSSASEGSVRRAPRV
jgi:hypothetical protein